MYLATPVIAGARSVRDHALLLFENSFGTGYVGKRGATAAKDIWLAITPGDLTAEFYRWQKKWDGYDTELFKLARLPRVDAWRGSWQRLDDISYEFWLESYKLDCVDPFAEQIERKVSQGLTRAKVDADRLSEVVSPADATIPQQMEMALLDVTAGSLSEEEYLRAYWFKRGTWNGGAFYTAEDLSNELAVDVPIDKLTSILAERKQLHVEVDTLLDAETLQLVKLLRTLALWREYRKTFAQRFSLGLMHVTSLAAQELNIDVELVRWAQFDEVDQVANDPAGFQERVLQSVLMIDDQQPKFILGDEARKIIDKFKHDGEHSSVEGMPAAKGFARGIVRVVLRESEFSRFQEGEILVTAMTRPEFLPLMRRAAAIVTDEGGLTSHAAIIARELKIPCIIGTKVATQVLHDGDEVEVDADSGIVRKIR